MSSDKPILDLWDNEPITDHTEKTREWVSSPLTKSSRGQTVYSLPRDTKPTPKIEAAQPSPLELDEILRQMPPTIPFKPITEEGLTEASITTERSDHHQHSESQATTSHAETNSKSSSDLERGLERSTSSTLEPLPEDLDLLDLSVPSSVDKDICEYSNKADPSQNPLRRKFDSSKDVAQKSDFKLDETVEETVGRPQAFSLLSQDHLGPLARSEDLLAKLFSVSSQDLDPAHLLDDDLSDRPTEPPVSPPPANDSTETSDIEEAEYFEPAGTTIAPHSVTDHIPKSPLAAFKSSDPINPTRDSQVRSWRPVNFTAPRRSIFSLSSQALEGIANVGENTDKRSLPFRSEEEKRYSRIDQNDKESLKIKLDSPQHFSMKCKVQCERYGAVLLNHFPWHKFKISVDLLTSAPTSTEGDAVSEEKEMRALPQDHQITSSYANELMSSEKDLINQKRRRMSLRSKSENKPQRFITAIEPRGAHRQVQEKEEFKELNGLKPLESEQRDDSTPARSAPAPKLGGLELSHDQAEEELDKMAVAKEAKSTPRPSGHPSVKVRLWGKEY